jgi:hypothetical protein
MSDLIQSTAAIKMYKGQSSRLILIIGKSGYGKSASIMNLNPEETFIINVIGKELPFMKSSQYIKDKNIIARTDSGAIQSAMTRISKDEKFSDIHNIIIDDLQYVMATEFMNNSTVKGYDKFSTMANNIYQILLLASKLRVDLNVFLLAHEEETPTTRRMKTLGRLLEEKITPEGMATIVLFAEAEVGESSQRSYYFTTATDGITCAKSPMGMFPPKIPNDLQLVVNRINEYYSGIELEKSTLNFNI